MTVSLDQKGPLELGIEIETAEGAVFRLDADALKASNVPTAMSFSTQRGDGFATASFALSREIFREYPDLALLNTVRFVGRQGDIAYEGLIQSFPRTNDPQQQITVQCVGYMTSLKWKPMAALIVDRRLGGWSEPSTQRKAGVLTTTGPWRYEGALSTGWQYSGALGPAVVLSLNTFDATYKEIGEAWLYAGGEDIAELRFDYKRLEGSVVSPDFHALGLLAADDQAVSTDPGTDLHAANTEGVVVVATVTGRKFALLQVYVEGTFAGTEPNDLAFLFPRIVGTHGLTAHGTSPEEGYYITDVMRHLVQTYGSKVIWEGEENQFLVQQCTWHDSPKTVYDAIQELNNYVLWELNVFEERKLRFEPADLTKADWQLRTDDPGVSVQFQGDSIENFANGVVVTYSDFFGHTYTLYPDDHPELQDENENNPAARHGEDIWISYTIPWQCLEGEALQFGRAYLAENNRPKRPGTFTVQGYIRDAAGHRQEAWKVRNSQTLSVMDDQYEAEPRLITATTYDEESATLSITVDAPSMRFEAIVARQQQALEARGLSG